MPSFIACWWWPAERLKLRKYFINDKQTTHKTLWIMTFKPFSPEKYLFTMTLTVSIEQREKVNLFRPNIPQKQKHRFMSLSPYCHVVRLNGPSAYIRTPLLKGGCVTGGWGGGIKGWEITGCIGVSCPWWKTVSKNSLTSLGCASVYLTIKPWSVFRDIISRLSWRFLSNLG